MTAYEKGYKDGTAEISAQRDAAFYWYKEFSAYRRNYWAETKKRLRYRVQGGLLVALAVALALVMTWPK